MNKWIETYMEEKNLKPNELFKLDSQTFKGGNKRNAGKCKRIFLRRWMG